MVGLLLCIVLIAGPILSGYDVITFFSQRTHSNSLFPVDDALSVPVTFFETLKSHIIQIHFIANKKTLGVLPGLP